MQFGHPPIVQVLSASHGVGEVDAPAIAVIRVGQGGSNPPFGHYCVRLAQKRFRDYGYFYSGSRSFHCGAQTGATGANY
jgi:hypothetical protein